MISVMTSAPTPIGPATPSFWHEALQPSPAVVLPSSHPSPGSMLPLPHKAVNGGANVQYAYGTPIQMANSGGTLALQSGSTVVDFVAYAGDTNWPKLTLGVAVQLAPDKSDSAANDVGSSWCNASAMYGNGLSGTPGTANSACVAPQPPPPQAGFAPGNAQFDAYWYVFSRLMHGQLFGWL